MLTYPSTLCHRRARGAISCRASVLASRHNAARKGGGKEICSYKRSP
jgi:hypothetical protein